MNIAVPQTDRLTRRVFTADDIARMVASGILDENERVELIEGDLLVMAAKGPRHDIVKSLLALALARAAPDDLLVGVENTTQLSETVLVEPDICIVPRSVYRDPKGAFARVAHGDMLLAVEVAVTNLEYDRTVKAQLYARHGVREYWLIDVESRIVWVHTGPTGEGWSSIVQRGPHDALTTAALPGFATTLAEPE